MQVLPGGGRAERSRCFSGKPGSQSLVSEQINVGGTYSAPPLHMGALSESPTGLQVIHSPPEESATLRAPPGAPCPQGPVFWGREIDSKSSDAPGPKLAIAGGGEARGGGGGGRRG